MIEGLFQPTHLLIILGIVLIVYGPGKLPEVGGAVGKAMREFRTGIKDAAAAVDAPRQIGAAAHCPSCGASATARGQRFCGGCGASLEVREPEAVHS